MGTVAARLQLPGASVAEAQALWLDLACWPGFVDGFGTLARREGEWPQAGARIVWDSLRNGRGRVVEHVLEYEPLVSQLVSVEDPRLHGTQRVRFIAVDGGCEIHLELAYELTDAGGAERDRLAAEVAPRLDELAAAVDLIRRELVG